MIDKQKRKQYFISIFSVIFCVFAVTIIIKKNQLNQFGTYSTNFAVGNWTAQSEQNYYFINSDNKIYKMDKTGEKAAISSDNRKQISFLNLVDNWIYYLEVSDEFEGEDRIYKMRIDGNEKQELYSAPSIYKIFVVNNKIYFELPRLGLCVMDISGRNEHVLEEDKGNDPDILGQYILQGQKNKRIKADYYKYNLSLPPQVTDEWLYVFENMKPIGSKFYLRRLSLDGVVDERIESNITDYLIVDEYIYYVKEEEGVYLLYQMNLDGSGNKRILKESFPQLAGLNYAGDKLFFRASHMENNKTKAGTYCVNLDGSELWSLSEDE
jgi:hypothetical protein